MAWRSQEQSQHFKKKMKESGYDKSSHRKQYSDGRGPEVMPDEFFAKEDLYDGSGRLICNKGDFNLRQVKGEQARLYFERVLGIPLPPGVSRLSNSDPRVQAAYGNKPGQ